MNNNQQTNKHYYYNYQYQNPQLALQLIKPEKPLTKKRYLKKIIKIQSINFLILLLISAIQVFALWTNDWFVLNVNEYVQTAKGGLWKYCYLTSSNVVGSLDCFAYEDLPNFFVFAKDRLYDSRVFLLCSSGFLGLLLVIELLAIFFLSCSNFKCCGSCDAFLAQRARKIRFISNFVAGDSSSPQLSLKMYKPNATSSFVITDQPSKNVYDTGQLEDSSQKLHKPTGYFMFLAFSLVTTIGSVLEFVLKTAGFAFFDGYINEILSFNQVFMAFRSYSYWEFSPILTEIGAMVGNIVFTLIYWIFKVVFIRYAITLTIKFINSDIQQPQKPQVLQQIAPKIPVTNPLIEQVQEKPPKKKKEQRKVPKRVFQRGRLDRFLADQMSLDSESTVNVNPYEYFQERASFYDVYRF